MMSIPNDMLTERPIRLMSEKLLFRKKFLNEVINMLRSIRLDFKVLKAYMPNSVHLINSDILKILNIGLYGIDENYSIYEHLIGINAKSLRRKILYCT